MTHQPYEEWLFDPAELNAEQAAALQEHLRGCQACTELQINWQRVQALIADGDEVPVPEGFTHRWETNLPERIALRRKAQTRRMLRYLGGGVFLGAVALSVFIAATTTPAEMVHRLIQMFTGVGSTVNEGQAILTYLLRIAPAPVLFFLGLALISWLVILGGTWIFTIMRFSANVEGNQ